MSIFDIFAKLEQERRTKPAAQPVEWLVVGLGNPGKKYENTRHNTGFRVMDVLCARHGVRCDRAKFQALTAEAVLGGRRALLLKPQTYMNASGGSVADALAYYRLSPAELIVIYDDISLDIGRLRIRLKGSDGGHNGIKSIISCLGTDSFARIKVGVGGKPHPDYDLADWVLSKFTAAELKIIGDDFERIYGAVGCLVNGDAEGAMGKYNG